MNSIKMAMEACPALQDSRCVVAVSGGVDSMVLLHGLYELNSCSALIVAHFEHGIRGEESKADAVFVEETAGKLGLPFCMESENIPSLCQGDNLEKVARQQRYAFLERIRKEHGADYILTAHHADDNLETVLMNFIRGCGLSGLSGMRERTGVILRPMLTVSKEQIETYARERGVGFRKDSTNEDTGYTRNRLRMEIIPELKSINPRLVENVTHMTKLLTAEDDYLERSAMESGSIQEREYGYDIAWTEPRAFLSRCIYHCLQQMMGRDTQTRMVEDVLALFLLGTGKRAKLNENVTAYRSDGGVSLVYAHQHIDGEYQITGNTQTPFGNFAVEQNMVFTMPEIDSNTIYYAGEGILTVRCRKNGDRLVPFGHGSSQKLKDYLIDKKVPVFLRDTLPIVCLDGEILAIPGVGRSDIAKVQKKRANRIIFTEKSPKKL